MPELTIVVAAIAAGGLVGGALLVAGNERPSLEITSLAARQLRAIGGFRPVSVARRRLARDLERAGRREAPDRVLLAALAIASCVGLLGAAVSAVVAIFGFAGSCVWMVLALKGAITKRRRRLSGELVPLLELFTLELSGGGSALAALGSVCVQVESGLAVDLRRMLIASHVAGSSPFEARLIEYADETEIQALGSLATILGATRDYGTAASQGVRALATDLRRAQRRELISQSRRALNNVLLPSAIAVLLPFLGVLMFPAVTVLQRSLR
jgi:Flp pilus assembly protein TadB